MSKRKTKALLLLVCIVTFVFSISMLSWHYVRGRWEENARKQLSQTKQDTEISAPHSIEISPQEETEMPKQEVLEQYAVLSQQNDDMVGWLVVDGTDIDYPVMYSGDDFYLEHGFDKADSRSGLPYIDKRCNVEPYGTNTIIYAHNMKSAPIFTPLLHYKERDYYTKHPNIRFDTLYEEQEYEIVAVFEDQVYRKSDTVFKHYNFLDANSKDEFNQYVAGIQALSLYDTGVRPEYGDTFITLMTCSYHTENGRFVVVARKTQKQNPN